MVNTPLDAFEDFTFGCDPEGFIFKGDTPVPAEGLIPGTKAEPSPIEINGEIVGYSQVDGMAAEFNIPPVRTFRNWNRYIEATMKAIQAMLPPGHELRFIPSVTFPKEVWDKAPDSAKELGCSPDYNAWERCVNPPPCCPENPYLRTGAGHVHLGWTKDAGPGDTQHVINCEDLVRQLDWLLGGWSVKMDTDPTRRSLYGRAGACRIKDYGVEYRVLSNFWVTTRDRRLMVWNRMQQACSMMQSSFYPETAKKGMNTLLIESINKSELDKKLLSSYEFPLVSLTPPAPKPAIKRRRSSSGLYFHA